ncbi:MAG: hypothetical protein LBG93_04520 [Treponema sp.]|nr:hypothetical protein [Treponema sp.]
MQKIFFAVLLLVLTAFSPLAAAVPGIDFNIRFFDRRVYRLDQDPILIQVTITNNSPQVFRFRLANERAFTVDFDVRTSANLPVQAAPSLISLRSQSQQVFFREISLSAGESFSFVENLRDFASFTHAGTFVVQARLFPDLIQTVTQAGFWQGAAPAAISPGAAVAGAGLPLMSNRLSLNVRPPVTIGPDGIPVELDVAAYAVLFRERLPPDEVVTFVLTARQQGHWERFFLYLDLEAMLTRDGYRRRQWLVESEEGRRQMLIRYRQDLQNAVVDEFLSLIPIYFVIERTMFTANEGTVIATQYFREGNFIQRKRYEWYLRRTDDIWMIVGFSVTLLGAVDSLP